jgi:hypothetical protein
MEIYDTDTQSWRPVKRVRIMMDDGKPHDIPSSPETDCLLMRLARAQGIEVRNGA